MENLKKLLTQLEYNAKSNKDHQKVVLKELKESTDFRDQFDKLRFHMDLQKSHAKMMEEIKHLKKIMKG